MEDDSKTVVVIDNGSSTVKAGFAGDDAPRKIFPSYVGYTKKHPINLAMDEKAYYVGDEAKEKRGRVDIRHPIQDSLVSNWEDLENLWTYTFFNVLKVCPDEVYAVVSESPMNPAKYREKSVEILFELFNLEGAYLASKSLLSLYSTGRTTGCVVDSGHGVSFSVPIYEGYASPHSIQKLDIGGRHLDEYLNKILFEKGYEFTTPLELELLSEIKEKLCYVQENTKNRHTEIEAKTYLLPDDSIVRLSGERYSIPEALFNPKEKLNIDQPGLHNCVFKSIMKTNTEVRPEMFNNIIIAGGNTMYENFDKRLSNEIHLLAATPDIYVHPHKESKERLFSSWIGGSIIGHMETFNYLCILRKDYEEYGSKIVHDKTF